MRRKASPGAATSLPSVELEPGMLSEGEVEELNSHHATPTSTSSGGGVSSVGRPRESGGVTPAGDR